MWCQQLVLIVLVAVVAPALVDGGKKNNKGNCGEWVKGSCVPKVGTCGRGTMSMTREGDGCKKTEKSTKCKISCDDGSVIEGLANRAKGRGKGKGKGKGKGGINGCKYDKGEWSSCGSDGLIRRTDTLRAQSPSECKPTRTNTRTCTQSQSSMCRYSRGRWSPCRVGDKGYEERVRVDTLRPAAPSTCPQSRSISKECYDRKPLNCRYSAGEWSDCVDNMRTLNKTLLSGPTDKCDPSIVKERKCTDENGKELCFYGSWGEVTDCDENKQQIATRPLIAGDAAECKEATKTLKCRKSRGKKNKKNKGDRKQIRKRKNKRNGKKNQGDEE